MVLYVELVRGLFLLNGFWVLKSQSSTKKGVELSKPLQKGSVSVLFRYFDVFGTERGLFGVFSFSIQSNFFRRETS